MEVGPRVLESNDVPVLPPDDTDEYVALHKQNNSAQAVPLPVPTAKMHSVTHDARTCPTCFQSWLHHLHFSTRVTSQSQRSELPVSTDSCEDV